MFCLEGIYPTKISGLFAYDGIYSFRLLNPKEEYLMGMIKNIMKSILVIHEKQNLKI